MKNILKIILVITFIIVLIGFLGGCKKVTEKESLPNENITLEAPESIISNLFIKYNEAIEKNNPKIISDYCCDSIYFNGKKLIKNDYLQELISNFEVNKFYTENIETHAFSEDRFKINYDKNYIKNPSKTEKSYLVIDKINDKWKIIMDCTSNKLTHNSKPVNNYFEQQIKNKRVKEAYNEYYEIMKYDFQKKNIVFPPDKIYIRVIKDINTFELWVYSKDSSRYILFKEYEICFHSGKSGPKRVEGDFQVPEGFYYINVFNPNSLFHLSLGINYPNESDKILSNKELPGKDIYIHGSCVSIGCLAMTNERIKEIYLIAALSKGNGQEKIPVHIFPTRLTDGNLYNLKKQYRYNTDNYDFWDNLKTGYDYFEKIKSLFDFMVDEKGKYILK